MKLFVPNTYSEFSETISITKSGIYFSSSFMSVNDLLNSNYVKFFSFSEDVYKFGAKFSIEKERGSFSLIKTAESNKGMMTTAKAFTNSFPVLNNLIMKNKAYENRFEIKFDKDIKCYIFSVIPNFEFKCNRHEVPEDDMGIYRYIDSLGEIIYIGCGQIKKRIKETQRSKWDIKSVEYSIVRDIKKMKFYEAHHILNFENKRGTKPKYNILAGNNICLKNYETEIKK